MEKLAVTKVPIHEILARRWSPLAFDENKPVPDQLLERLFEAARWAASCNNAQPWHYVVAVRAKNPELFEKLSSTLAPGNSWALHVPVLALSVARMDFPHNQKPNGVTALSAGGTGPTPPHNQSRTALRR